MKSRRIRKREGKVLDFSCLLILDKNWAEMEHKKRSPKMLVRYVLTAINGDNVNRQKSFDWCRAGRDGFINVIVTSKQKAFEKHAIEEASLAGR